MKKILFVLLFILSLQLSSGANPNNLPPQVVQTLDRWVQGNLVPNHIDLFGYDYVKNQNVYRIRLVLITEGDIASEMFLEIRANGSFVAEPVIN